MGRDSSCCFRGVGGYWWAQIGVAGLGDGSSGGLRLRVGAGSHRGLGGLWVGRPVGILGGVWDGWCGRPKCAFGAIRAPARFVELLAHAQGVAVCLWGAFGVGVGIT